MLTLRLYQGASIGQTMNMVNRLSLPLGQVILAAGVISCSGASSEMNRAMPATADSGSVNLDAMVMDASALDAAVEMECDPIDGSGCTNDNLCFYIGDPIGVQCRMQVEPPKEHGQECSRSLKDCRAGFYCVIFQGESGNAKCRKVCNRSHNRDCESLTGNPDGYECKHTIDAIRNLGVCAPVVPECLPYDDMCEAGEYCEYTGGRIRCVAVPTSGGRVGGPCSTAGRCQRGGICITVNNEAKCYEPCNPDAAACSNPSQSCVRQTSLQGQDLPFGICR
jgi:hypothetical protein